MKCLECDQDVATHPDWRVPPLDIDDCLCFTCSKLGAEERIEDLESEIKELNTFLIANHEEKVKHA